MSMALSLAVLILLATSSLWVHLWHPLALLQVEAWLTLAGLSVGISRRHGVPSAHRGLLGRNGARRGGPGQETEPPPGGLGGQAMQS
jgi:hypothetical protein